MAGTLYIVATPIGNLGDLTVRAADTLRTVAAIACEDTRQTRKLLNHLGMEGQLIALHEHNERERASEIVHRLIRGDSIALVSDAGTPLISDPGYRLIDAVFEAGLTVVPIPGPCAAIAALSASGLPTDAFYFGGFLPPKTTQRQKALTSLKSLEATLIFYEAPHRIIECLEDIEAVLGNRSVVVARELTKLYEEFLRGPASEVRAKLTARDTIKGEFTVLIGKAAKNANDDQRPIEEAVAELEAQGVARMDAIKTIAKQRGLGKREVYRLMNP